MSWTKLSPTGTPITLEITTALPDESLLVTRVAGQTVSGHRAVRVDSAGLLWLADKDSSLLAPHTCGITAGAIMLGASGPVILYGRVEEPSWAWAAGPVWLGDDGQLTQTPPTTGALVQVGITLGPTTIRVSPLLIALL